MLSRSVGVVLALAFCAPVAAQEGPIGHLERLGSALRAEGVWQAEYEQVYTASGMTLGEEAQGTVWVSWPDKAYFRVGSPTERLMGLEGRTVRLVDLEVPTCDDHLMDEQEWARIPLAAVLDPQSAVDSFVVLPHGDDGFALVPHEPGGVDRVEVELDESSLPTEVLIIDPQGASNRLVFSGWKTVAEPAGGTWLPTPPEGVGCTTDIE